VECWPIAAHSIKVKPEMKNTNETHLLDLENTTAQLEILHYGTPLPKHANAFGRKQWIVPQRSRSSCTTCTTCTTAPLHFQFQGVHAAKFCSSYSLCPGIRRYRSLTGDPLHSPGSTLYPAKRSLESTWLALAPEAQKPEIQLRILDQRIREMDQLLEAQRLCRKSSSRIWRLLCKCCANARDLDEPETLQHLRSSLPSCNPWKTNAQGSKYL
jgi:hypothetical protein